MGNYIKLLWITPEACQRSNSRIQLDFKRNVGENKASNGSYHSDQKHIQDHLWKTMKIDYATNLNNLKIVYNI
jgi:hypothetical protein